MYLRLSRIHPAPNDYSKTGDDQLGTFAEDWVQFFSISDRGMPQLRWFFDVDPSRGHFDQI